MKTSHKQKANEPTILLCAELFINDVRVKFIVAQFERIKAIKLSGQ